MMGRVAELLRDLGGVKAAGGGANSLTLTANSGFTAYANGLRVTLRAVATNTGAVSLNVNGIGQKTVRKITGLGEETLKGGEIREPGIYEFIYCTVLNSGGGGWLLVNPTQEQIPAGVGAPCFRTTAPPGWLVCNGAAVSRTTYARLFSAIGTVWGEGDGTTTFNLPDARRDYLRGAGPGGLTVGTRQADETRKHTHDITIAPGGVHKHDIAGYPMGFSSGSVMWARRNPALGGQTVAYETEQSGQHSHTASASETGGDETRPRSIVVHWIIKT